MEITFHNIRKIKIDSIKNSTRAGADWLQIKVCDEEGEHVINCFPEIGETIPISLHPMGDDEDDD